MVFLLLIGLIVVILFIISGFMQDFMTGLTLLLFFGVLFYAITYFLSKAVKKKEVIRENVEKNATNIITSKLEKLEFNVSKKVDIIVDTYNFKFIAIDEQKNKIVFGDVNHASLYDYSEILESRIIEDGQEIITTSRSSQIGRAMVGGILAGGIGAIIGGGGATQTQTSEVKSISLRVVVNNISNPYFEINFLEDKNNTYVSRDSFKYREASRMANEWQNVISIIIKQADTLDRRNEKTMSSISDELEKLSSLKIQGILNEEEFQLQKTKLLNA